MIGPYDSGFTTPEMKAVFSPAATVGALLEFEAALALALADAGVAPLAEAQAVAEACREPLDDPEAILSSTWEEGTPIITLTSEITKRLPGEAERRWVHRGATSQDAVDSALMLQSRQGLHTLEERLVTIARLMKDLVETHRNQPQIGRTFLQHARPTTFGIRVAMWLDPALRHIEEMRLARSGLAVQLGGPVGNLAAYGPAATEVVTALAGRLGLAAPDIAWHSDRSRVEAMVGLVARSSSSMAKVATDITLLAQSDTGELRVRPGGSSSMPGKRNPIDPVRAIAAADACAGAASMMTRGRSHELDRALGAWHVEWLAIPLVFQTADAVMEAMERCLQTLEVDTEMMGSRAAADDLEDIGRHQIDRVLSRFELAVGDGS